jgi:hypothetical protein
LEILYLSVIRSTFALEMDSEAMFGPAHVFILLHLG